VGLACEAAAAAAEAPTLLLRAADKSLQLLRVVGLLSLEPLQPIGCNPDSAIVLEEARL